MGLTSISKWRKRRKAERRYDRLAWVIWMHVDEERDSLAWRIMCWSLDIETWIWHISRITFMLGDLTKTLKAIESRKT